MRGAWGSHICLITLLGRMLLLVSCPAVWSHKTIFGFFRFLEGVYESREDILGELASLSILSQLASPPKGGINSVFERGARVLKEQGKVSLRRNGRRGRGDPIKDIVFVEVATPVLFIFRALRNSTSLESTQLIRESDALDWHAWKRGW